MPEVSASCSQFVALPANSATGRQSLTDTEATGENPQLCGDSVGTERSYNWKNDFEATLWAARHLINVTVSAQAPGSGPLCLLCPQTSCHRPPHAPRWHACPPASLPSLGLPGVLRASLLNCHRQPRPCGVLLGPGAPLDIPGHDATVTGPSTNKTVPRACQPVAQGGGSSETADGFPHPGHPPFAMWPAPPPTKTRSPWPTPLLAWL